MNEPFFFPRGAGLTVRDISALTGAQPVEPCDLERRVNNVASLSRAGRADLAYLESGKYAAQLATTRAGVCLVPKAFAVRTPSGACVLISAAPYRDFVTVAQALFPDAMRPSTIIATNAAGALAHVDPSARLESGVRLDPGVVVGPAAEIGSGTVIAANAVIGRGVRIGRDCAIGPGAAIEHALIGDRVTIHGGCRIGQDGFGYVSDARGHHKVPQLGRVIIQDEVEIGANTTIDRGGLSDTVIGEGTKIDNLVQIGHNVTVGRRCVIVSQCGISGSVTIGDYAVLGGQVGVADHVVIGEGARIGAKSGVIGDIPPGETWFGYPAMRGSEYLRAMGGARGLRARQGKASDRKGGEERA